MNYSLTSNEMGLVGGKAGENRKTTEAKERYPRVTVRLTGEMGAVMNDLEEITGATSPSEVVRRAIVIYHTLAKQRLAGNNPVIEVSDEDGTRKIPIFL